MNALLRKPSAWIPLVMSLTALGLVVAYLAFVGWDHQPEDEGTAARLFQLLLAGQVPIVAYFLVRWLEDRPRAALRVVAMQVAAALTPFLLVFFLER
jgi:hypothetical protein